MVRCESLFSQLVALFNRNQFYQLVIKHKAERYSKGFNSWDHFVAMLFCQLAQAKSLREISGGLACCMGKLRHLGMKDAPKKSTLSYANAHRPWEMYRDLFYNTLEICKGAAPGKHKFRFKNKLLSLDSSTISLCLSLFPWAKFRRTKGAIKLHLLLDHDGYLPTYAYISNGKKHDVTVARKAPLAPGSIVAMDRGYNDYKLFAYWTANGIYFVTRQKENADYEVIEDRKLPKNRSILSDQLIRFTGYKAKKNCPHILRRVVVWDKDEEREIVLLTNHLDFDATTISAIYKERWQIEIFFKALKQNLKVKTFVGTTENALYIQIWTALIAILLIKFLQFKSKFGWSLSNLIAFLHWNLFTYRDLWEWIDNPFDVLPIMPESVQIQLPLPGIGQHLQMKTT
ncbi:MAG: IS4 family transposase [Desulfobacteraceae bacterium]|nr:IS4 family transposase [Desulfobacteraceae bacterium]